MKSNNRRCALNGLLLLCASAACDDAIVGRRWPIEVSISSDPSSGGAQTSDASGGRSTSGGSASANGGTPATQWSAGAPSLAGASAGGTSETDASCAIGIKVHRSSGVCATVPPQGDVDCNGIVDIVDALKLAQVVEGVQSYPLYEPAGDLNCDGCLTDDDATLIAEVTAGSRVAQPCDNSE